jgi:phage regulator Rha-like protein
MADTKKGKLLKAKNEIVKHGNADLLPTLMREVEDKIAVIRNQEVIADADVAALYGVQTKEVNQAVRNNHEKFPARYMFELNPSELRDLRSKILTTNVSVMNRNSTKVFTERGLYMLATILKGERARDITFAIIETFARVRELKRELLDLHKETDKSKQASKMQHFGEVLTDMVMPDLQTSETESTLEINFFIGKLKHTVKRVRKENGDKK